MSKLTSAYRIKLGDTILLDNGNAFNVMDIERAKQGCVTLVDEQLINSRLVINRLENVPSDRRFELLDE